MFELHDIPAQAVCKSVNDPKTCISHIPLYRFWISPNPEKVGKLCIIVPIFQGGKTESSRSQGLYTNLQTELEGV